MFSSINQLPNRIPPSDKPDPKAAQALQEGLGGQFGEMRTMMQYLFQNMNFRGEAKAYQESVALLLSNTTPKTLPVFTR
jgi:Mn-containing catalase